MFAFTKSSSVAVSGLIKQAVLQGRQVLHFITTNGFIANFLFVLITDYLLVLASFPFSLSIFGSVL
jgi:hypothetical protein